MTFREYISEDHMNEGQINWLEPDFNKELDEYFGDLKGSIEKRKIFKQQYGLDFKTEEELIAFLQNGRITNIDTKDLPSMNIAEWEWSMNMSDEDWKDDLKNDTKNDSEFSTSYNSMEKKLHDTGIELPMPIIIKFTKGDETIYSGYSGQRRANLAMRNKQPLKVWMVTV